MDNITFMRFVGIGNEDAPLQPKCGLSLNEYASDDAIFDLMKKYGITYEAAQKELEVVWYNNRPPAGVCGVYAFVRFGKVDPYIVPSTIMDPIIDKILERVFPEANGIYNDFQRSIAYDKTTYGFCEGVRFIKPDEVKTIYAHVWNADVNGWKQMDIEELGSRVKEIYEVFLELK